MTYPRFKSLIKLINPYPFSVVTIYATLGDEAIAHGINETDVSTVITTYDLLPKFKKILAKTPRVDTIIYMEDQLKSIDRDGYKQGIKIVGYKDVIAKGAASKIGNFIIILVISAVFHFNIMWLNNIIFFGANAIQHSLSKYLRKLVFF